MGSVQLKSLAKSTEALNKITAVINNTDLSLEASNEELNAIAKSYTNETLKAAMAQSTLKDTQIETMLSANGMQGALLKTTTDEIANAASTNAVAASQTRTSLTTLGLGEAFQGLGIKIRSAAASLRTFLTTTPLGWATLAAGAMAGLSAIINKHNASLAEAREKARQRMSELYDEFKQMDDGLTEHRKTVSELADRYDQLSKGVNLSTNEKTSLSTDEYEEFLDISERLGDAFPELIKGIDDNGNSILSLGASGITAKEQLEELLQAEEDLNHFKIAQGLGEAFQGVYTYVEDANSATAALRDIIKEANAQMGALNDFAKNGIRLEKNNYLLFNGEISDKAKTDYVFAMQSAAQQFLDELDDSRRIEIENSLGGASGLFYMHQDEWSGTFDLYANLHTLTTDEIAALEEKMSETVPKGIAFDATLPDSFFDQQQELQYQIQKGKNAWSEFVAYLASGMRSKSTFKALDPDLQDIALHIVSGLDYSYASAMKAYDPDPYAYVRDKFLTPMSELDDADKDKLQSSFENLMKLNAGDLSQKNQAEIESLIKTIASLLDKEPLEIRAVLGFDTEEAQNRYHDALKEAKRKFGSPSYGYDDRGFEVNRGYETNDDIGNELDAFWNENVLTEKDVALWNEVTAGITDAAEAMETYTEAKSKENAESFPVSQTIPQTVDQLNTRVKPAFDSLRSAYQEIFKDDGSFDRNNIDLLSTCDAIQSKLDELNQMDGISVDYSAFEHFVTVLNDTESTEKNVQDAFDALAGSITQAALNGTEDYSILKSVLADLGVVNNELVAFDALTKNAEALKEAGMDLAEASEDQMRAFVAETVSAENAAQAYDMLALQKGLYNLQEMNTATEIANLKALAENIGYTGDAIEYLTELEGIYQNIARGTYGADSQQAAEAQERATQLTALISESFAKVSYKPTLDYSSAAKKSAADAAQALDSYLDAQEKALDAGKISFREYCDNLSFHIRKAYDNGKISAKEFWDYQGRFLEKQKSSYDKVINAVTRKLDGEIDALRDRQDEIDAFYESQISSLEETRKLLQETNDERKRQADLQKALYEMERAHGQKTVLQYSEGMGLHYVSDPNAVRDAENSVADARLDIRMAEIDNAIAGLERQRDSEKSAIDDIIQNLEAYKAKWDDVSSACEEAQEDQIAAAILGQEWEADVLSMRLDTLSAFTEDYVNLQRAIADAAWESARAQAEAQKLISGQTADDPDNRNAAIKKVADYGAGIADALRDKFDLSKHPLKFHTGLKQGLVDTPSLNKDFQLVRDVGLGRNEVPAVLKKGEIVATQEQVSNLASGLRQAGSQTILVNGMELRALQPGDETYDLMQKWDAYFGRIDGNVEKFLPGSFYEQRGQVNAPANQIVSNNVENHDRNVQPTIHNEIHVTLPNITNSTSAETLLKDLQSLGTKKLQASW